MGEGLSRFTIFRLAVVLALPTAPLGATEITLQDPAMQELRRTAGTGAQAPPITDASTYQARMSSCAAALGILEMLDILPSLPPEREHPMLDNYAYRYDAFDASDLSRRATWVRQRVVEACSNGDIPGVRLIPMILRDTSRYRKGFSAPYMDPDIRAVPKTVVEGLVAAAQGLFHPNY